MSRKSIVLAIGIALFIAGTVCAALVLLVRNEPTAYSRLTVPPGEERETDSKNFDERFFKLMNDIQCPDGVVEVDWQAEFTEQQINSFFQEGFVRSGINEKLLPEGICEPRVAIEPDLVRVMFQYGKNPWSTVISIDLKVWLAGKETNVVALELQSFRAGSLPISAQSLLERISDALRRNSIDVSWYRHNGNPVAVLHFQSDPQRPSVQLKRLDIEEGHILIHGSSSDGSSPAAMLPASLRRAFTKPALALVRK